MDAFFRQKNQNFSHEIELTSYHVIFCYSSDYFLETDMNFSNAV